MGCCTSRGIASPLFEELIYKIGNQQGVNGLKCVELIEELKKKNLIDSNGGEIMKSLFTPLLYPEGMPIVKTEENKITEAFLSFDNKDIVVTNPSLFVLQYCISFSSVVYSFPISSQIHFCISPVISLSERFTEYGTTTSKIRLLWVFPNTTRKS